jgi:hypothetical protein
MRVSSASQASLAEFRHERNGLEQANRWHHHAVDGNVFVSPARADDQSDKPIPSDLHLRHVRCPKFRNANRIDMHFASLHPWRGEATTALSRALIKCDGDAAIACGINVYVRFLQHQR